MAQIYVLFFLDCAPVAPEIDDSERNKCIIADTDSMSLPPPSSTGKIQ